jgi:hypothetical protein
MPRSAAAAAPRTSSARSRARPAASRARNRSADRTRAEQRRGPAKAAPSLAHSLTRLAHAPVIDRLLRGRLWVVCIGALLAGIVFLNVSLLEMNEGTARSSARSEKLERSNSKMRAKIARLGDSERIRQAAMAAGFVSPLPDEVRYLRSHPDADAARAVARIVAPAGAATALGPAPQPATPGGAPQPQQQPPSAAAGQGAPAAQGPPIAAGQVP